MPFCTYIDRELSDLTSRDQGCHWYHQQHVFSVGTHINIIYNRCYLVHRASYADQHLQANAALAQAQKPPTASFHSLLWLTGIKIQQWEQIQYIMFTRPVSGIRHSVCPVAAPGCPASHLVACGHATLKATTPLQLQVFRPVLTHIYVALQIKRYQMHQSRTLPLPLCLSPRYPYTQGCHTVNLQTPHMCIWSHTCVSGPTYSPLHVCL